jgi:YhcH/YjgK/YiaL family protein
MILDKIENIDLYKGIHVGVNKALYYIQNTDFSNMLNGKYDIDGDSFFVIVKEYETKDMDDNLLEAHLKYIDVHYIAEGIEQIGITTLVDQKAKKAYDPVDDYMLFNSPCDFITLNKGMFAIFYPNDMHIPEIKSGNISKVKKIVVKVKI